MSKNETMSKKRQTMALGSSDARLVFRKRVYRHVHDIPNDPIEYHLLYAEAVNKVVKVSQNIHFYLYTVKHVLATTSWKRPPAHNDNSQGIPDEFYSI